MSTKLYVGGLPYSVDENQLEEFFAKQGQVTSAIVIKDKFSGQSKGFGFVEMEDDNAAKEAIKQLNGTDFGGRSITVNEARPREDRPRDGGGRNNQRGDFRR